MNDELGKRMKENYEQRTRYFVPRRTYTIIRVDGKAFHTFTRGFKRPFDRELMNLMDQTAIALCKGIQGAVLGYTQSDEISIVICDFATPHTDAWFDGNIQKMASISASIATVAFNRALLVAEAIKKEGEWHENTGLPHSSIETEAMAMFDSRVFTIPDRTEVFNYLIWRQQDAVRNSIQMAAQSMYSQTQLHAKNCNVLQEMMFQKGTNWNDYTSGEKRGRIIVKEQFTHNSKTHQGLSVSSLRTKWVSYNGAEGEKETPSFTQDRDFLTKLIPSINEIQEKDILDDGTGKK